MSTTKESSLGVTEIDCKTALSPSRLPDFDYSLNPYKGCRHNCAYCYVPGIQKLSREEWGSCVLIKRNIPKVLSKELKTKTKGIVGISTTTDPYQPLEEKFNLTRLCLLQLLRHDYPVSIITKSPLVIKDIDILSQFSNAEVGITITTLNEEERKLFEPNAPPIDERVSALHTLSKNDISTYAFLGPLYPTIELKEIEDLFYKIRDTGISKIMVDRLNLKPGIWDSIKGRIGDDRDKLSIWSDAVFGRTKTYDKLFLTISQLCKDNSIKFENQGY